VAKARSGMRATNGPNQFRHVPLKKRPTLVGKKTTEDEKIPTRSVKNMQELVLQRHGDKIKMGNV
jgi:hypothetical protein